MWTRKMDQTAREMSQYPEYRDCEDCMASGGSRARPCETCNGTGRMPDNDVAFYVEEVKRREAKDAIYAALQAAYERGENY